MEAVLQKILTGIMELKTDVAELKTKMDVLYEFHPKNVESHQWLEALYHNSQVHKAEINQVQYKVANIEGVMTGVGRLLLQVSEEG